MNEKISHIIFLKVTKLTNTLITIQKWCRENFILLETPKNSHILYKIKKDFPEKQTALYYKKSLPAETKALDYEF